MLIRQDFVDAVREYRKLSGRDYEPGTPEAKEYARQCSLALFMEVAELVDSFQWKPWRSGVDVDVPNLQREIVDILHFIIHLVDSLGEDMLDETLDLRAQWVLDNNKARLVNGYSMLGDTHGGTHEGTNVQRHDR